MKYLATVMALALALFGGCSDEPEETRLLVMVSSEPTATPISILRFLFSQKTDAGTIWHPVDPGNVRFNQQLGHHDPSEMPVISQIDYGEVTFMDPTVRMQVIGYADGVPVAMWAGDFNLNATGMFEVQLTLLTEACDVDADGFPDCSVDDCCAEGTEYINDCEPNEANSFPWHNTEMCNGVDDDCNGKTDEGIAGIGVECSAGIDDCRRIGVMECLGGTEPTCSVVDQTSQDDACNDENPCTSEGLCSYGKCENITNLENGTSCSDGDVCTDNDVCVSGQCAKGPQINCDDSKLCTFDSCHPTDGCKHEDIPSCVCGVDNDCDDSNPCTDDSCAGGVCDFAPNAATCEDGDACTTGDVCSGGSCVSGTPLMCDDGDTCNGLETCNPASGCQTGTTLDCDDNDVCTNDSCNPISGCFNDLNTATCDDGDACTENDVCASGTCGGTTLNCDDGLLCTNDSCNSTTGCLNAPIIGCTCETDLNCADGNVCTDDSCTDGTCDFAPNNLGCDDGSACTTGDVCASGTCGGTAVDCDDSNVCTDDSCDSTSGCVYINNTDPCNDGDVCTMGDLCSNGLCENGSPLTCNDNNVCTDDSCDSASGCVYVDNAATCDDVDVCTTGDVCSGGSCSSGSLLDCDDGNVCTDDSCDLVTGCVYVDNAATCDDVDVCTVGEQCSGGSCAGGLPPVCDDGNVCTDDSCDSDSGCVFVDNSLGCDDGSACTASDMCASSACGGTIIDCDDGDPCTDDSCDSASGCVYVNNTATCDDGDACTTGEQCSGGSCVGGSLPDCDDGNVCTNDSCDSASGCVYVNNSLGCDDGNPCTGVDVCSGGSCVGGSPPNCDDGIPCTIDDCNTGTGACVNTMTNPCSIVIPAGDYYDTPSTTVPVSEFTIMANEVTIGQYVDGCVNAVQCSGLLSGTGCNFGVSNHLQHPANCVTFAQATEYCTWVGGSLPTEHQWKKAARGGCEVFGGPECLAADDYLIYSWGPAAPDCTLAVFNDGVDGCGNNEAWPVGSKPAGMSPYGLQDTAGNVAEWVISTTITCDSNMFFACGGGWKSSATFLEIDKCGCIPLTQGAAIGFRCVLP